jgi:hypothetical protein
MKKVLPLLLFSLCAVSAYSQREVDENTSWSIKDRAYLGLGFGGLGFGSSSTYGNYFSIGVSPQVGYMLTKNMSTGLGFEYQYTSYSDLDIRNHMYGWYPYLRYNIKDFFLQADYDWYSIDNVLTPETDRLILDRFFIGAGYASLYELQKPPRIMAKYFGNSSKSIFEIGSRISGYILKQGC